MKNIPNIPATSSAWTRLAPVTLRERKIRRGMSGVRAVASRSTKAASSASATAPRSRRRSGCPAEHEGGQQRQRDRAEEQRARRAPAPLGGRLDDRVDAEHE